MLRGIILFLVSCPLLMPPGFCICKLFPLIQTPSATTTQVGRSAGNEQVCEPRCRCCHRNCPAVPLANFPAGDKASAQEKSPSSPPEDHLPSCPAHPSWVIERAVVPSLAGPLTLDTEGSLCSAPSSWEFTLPTSPLAVAADLPHLTVPSQPVFVLLCDFRC